MRLMILGMIVAAAYGVSVRPVERGGLRLAQIETDQETIYTVAPVEGRAWFVEAVE